ncbi:MAG: anaerobic magnesium-protoporphyrin IX monomethyl ester cyclase elongator protein [uncultured bacterium]|nr:MAG: anaerobic magnesium-protoporphyrin IX monomethyl ester cyclase elongator protein [uncultured bacterium]
MSEWPSTIIPNGETSKEKEDEMKKAKTVELSPFDKRKQISAEDLEENGESSLESGESIAMVKVVEQAILEHEKYNIKPKKVILIDGNRCYAKDIAYRFGDDEEESSGFIPLGLARIAGYLDKHKVPCSMVRLQDLDNSTKEKDILKLVIEADIVAVSSLSPSIGGVFSALKQFKELNPKLKTVLGAQHALDYEHIVSHKDETNIDACVIGQGEIALTALAYGVPDNQIGNMAYLDETSEATIIKRNANYPRLTEQAVIASELMRPVAAREISIEWSHTVVPELAKIYPESIVTESNSGCKHPCKFCTNLRMYGTNCESTLETSESEIKKGLKRAQQLKQDILIYFADGMINTSDEHLEAIVSLMTRENASNEYKAVWYAFTSVEKEEDAEAGCDKKAMRLGKMARQFEAMSQSGCVMLAFGMEDVVGDRSKQGKGADLERAIEVTDSAREKILVRLLLIMGLEDHYNFSRDEIKERTLSHMKAHPQAAYRINSWTPIVGTSDFDKYHNFLTRDVRKDPEAFSEHDTMHGVIDPVKMYDSLGIPEEQRWVKDPKDWVVLRNEIMQEYLRSPEHEAFLETLKGKSINGKENILYDIAVEFRRITLTGIEK